MSKSELKIFTTEKTTKNTFNEDNPYKNDRTRTAEAGAWDMGYEEGKSGKPIDQNKFNSPAMQSLRHAYLEGQSKGSEQNPAKAAVHGGKTRKHRKGSKKSMKKKNRKSRK